MAPAVHHGTPPPRHSHHVSDSRTRPRRDEASWSRSPRRTERKGTARSSDRGEASKSPSPHTKRLRRAVGEKDEFRSSREVRKERSGSPVERRRRDKSGSPVERRRRDKSGSLVERRRRDRSGSPVERPRRGRRSSGSPVERERRRRQNSVSPSRGEKGRNDSEADHPGDSEQDSLAKMKAAEEALTAKQKEKPSFELSGKLAEETNRFRGVTLLFTEPADARKPNIRWRLYVFKAGEALNDPLYVHRQSCYLFGRERRVADIPTDHPSCSKQHAIIQYRVVEKEQADGMMKKQVRPYLMDLGSTNGTFLNDNRLEPQRYYELFEKDTIKFGNSSREYVLLHENSAQ